MIERFVRPKLGFYWYLFEPAVLFFLAFFIAWAIFEPPNLLLSIKDFEWGGATVTIFATFLGAMSAFLLESLRERRSQSHKDLASGQLAFLKLARMVNRLENIKRNYVDPARESPARAIEIPAILALDPNDPQIDMDLLHYMFAKHANLLGEIAIARDQFASVIDLVNERSRFLRSEIQSRLKAAGIPQDFEMDVRRLSGILGPGNLQEAINLTDQLVESLDRVTAQVHDVTNRFGSVLNYYFPTVKLSLTLDEAP